MFSPLYFFLYKHLRQHRWETALRLSTISAAPEESALGVHFFRRKRFFPESLYGIALTYSMLRCHIDK